VVKVSINTNKINPPNQIIVNNPQTNPQPLNNIMELQKQIEYLQQQLQKVEDAKKQISQALYPQPQLQNNQNQNEFVIKSNMKASIIALKVEQILMAKKKAILSGLGFAITIELDAIMLIKKDLERYNANVNIQFELFERQVVGLGGKQKTITGLRAIISI